jgi:hypothetical protein
MVAKLKLIYFQYMEEFTCQALNICGNNDVRQTEMHIVEPLVHELNFF